jgi:hypothetical protein
MMNSNRGGRGYIRGGRGRGQSYGRGRSRFGGRTSNSTKIQERELKFSPHQYQVKTQVTTYATTKEAVIQHIQKSYKGGQDIAKSLEDMIMVDLVILEPTRAISAGTDGTAKVVDQAGLDIKYQEELRRHLNRKDALREGLNKGYALIFTNYCTKVMQWRIEEHPEDYETNFKNNPIAVLEAIKTLMHDPVRAQYPMVLMTDALGRLIDVKQQENESILDYIKRFKQLRNVTKSQMGYKFLDKFVEHQADYIASHAIKQRMLKDQAHEKWMAYLSIRGTDQTKYGSLVKGFTSQFSLGNDQYPKTLMTTLYVLSNHKIDQQFYENQKKNREQSRDEQSRDKQPTNDESSNATSFAQREREMTCYVVARKDISVPNVIRRITKPCKIYKTAMMPMMILRTRH